MSGGGSIGRFKPQLKCEGVPPGTLPALGHHITLGRDWEGEKMAFENRPSIINKIMKRTFALGWKGKIKDLRYVEK